MYTAHFYRFRRPCVKLQSSCRTCNTYSSSETNSCSSSETISCSSSETISCSCRETNSCMSKSEITSCALRLSLSLSSVKQQRIRGAAHAVAVRSVWRAVGGVLSAVTPIALIHRGYSRRSSILRRQLATFPLFYDQNSPLLTPYQRRLLASPHQRRPLKPSLRPVISSTWRDLNFPRTRISSWRSWRSLPRSSSSVASSWATHR
jgi:hypothetical protein